MHIPLFPGHQPGEHIVMFVHRHRISFLIPVLIMVTMVALPVLILLVAPTLGFDATHSEWIIAGLGAYGLFALSVAFVLWMDYFYDFLILTDRHVVNVEQESLLGRRIAYISLLRVQDASGKTHGLLQSLFNYGTVIIETAGETPDVIQRDVPNPALIAHKTMELHDALIKKEGRHGELAQAEGHHPPGKMEAQAPPR